MTKEYRYTNAIDYLADFPGARRESDLIVVEVQSGTVDVTDRPDRRAGRVIVEGVHDNDALEVTTDAGEDARLSLEAPGAERLVGRVTADIEHDVVLEWTDADGQVLFEDVVGEDVSGDSETAIDAPAISPFVDVVVQNRTDSEVTVTATAHLR